MCLGAATCGHVVVGPVRRARIPSVTLSRRAANDKNRRHGCPARTDCSFRLAEARHEIAGKATDHEKAVCRHQRPAGDDGRRRPARGLNADG
jgi:hypothetical protein